MVFYAAVLPGFRILMVWLYDQTMSLFLAIPMHANLTGSTVVALAPQATATSLIVYDSQWAPAFGRSSGPSLRRP